MNIYINNNNGNDTTLPLIPIENVDKNSKVPAVKFLGIYIDQSLTFNYHVQHIASKISKSLYVIKSVKNILPPESLKTLYFSLIHSHLVYGIHIWSAAAQSVTNIIATKQKIAIRLITNAKYNAHTEPIFKSNNILPLYDLVKYFKMLFMCAYINNKLPISFAGVWVTNAAARNINSSLQLRNDSDLFIPFSRTDFCRRFPLFDFPRIWNEFDNADIKNMVNINTFKKSLKMYLLSNLSDVVTCNRLLCPSCLLNNLNN
jgi:hypothetical protein